jgi:hypothetical protein
MKRAFALLLVRAYPPEGFVECTPIVESLKALVSREQRDFMVEARLRNRCVREEHGVSAAGAAPIVIAHRQRRKRSDQFRGFLR